MGRNFYSHQIKSAAVRMSRAGFKNWEIRKALGLPISDVSIWRWNMLFNETQKVIRDPQEYDRLGRARLLTAEDRAFMQALIRDDPTLFLDEIQDELEERLGRRVSLATVQTELTERMRISLKKCGVRNGRQNTLKRQRFIDHFKTMPAEYLVFTGA